MNNFNEYTRDESGQFAIMFAIVSTLLLGMMMIAIDFNNMVATRAKVAAITDAAALAGAEAFDEAERIQIVKEFLNENSLKMLPAKLNGQPIIEFDDSTQEVSVSIGTEVELPFARMIGFKNKDVAYRSLAAYPETMDPLTIAFALDISGSMGGSTSDGQVKLAALKNATSGMFNIIEGKVRNPKSIDENIRTSVSAFHSSLAVDQDMAWGFGTTRATINGLVAGGATNTFAALENAHKQILDDRVFRRSSKPDFDIKALDEFVIFMTDGENTAGDPVLLDDESYETCIAMREDGIEVYAIAFTAPARGQMLLLDCASWDDSSEDVRSGKPQKRRRGCKVISAIARILPDVRGLQNAYERCKNKNLIDKKDHFYDASNAQNFEEIFKVIAEKINESSIRIKS